MKTACVSGGHIQIVSAGGRIDSRGAERLRCALRGATPARTPRLIVDMSHVTFIGSKGIQVLLEALAECQSKGGTLILAAVSPQVMHVLRLLEFDRIFTVSRSPDHAIGECRARSQRAINCLAPKHVC